MLSLNHLMAISLSFFNNLNNLFTRDDPRMAFVKIVQFSRPPTPLVHLRPKFLYPDLEHRISNEPPFLK